MKKTTIAGAMLLFASASVANAQQTQQSWQQSCINDYMARVPAYMQLTGKSRIIPFLEHAPLACSLMTLTKEEFVKRTTGMPALAFEELFGPLLIGPPKK